MKQEILMPKGTALWLAKYTRLTNQQVADFCNVHEIEVSALRNGVDSGVIEQNPIDSYVLSEENIIECERNSNKELKVLKLEMEPVKQRRSRSLAKKSEIINALVWLFHENADLPPEVAVSLFQCTASLAKSIKEKTYSEYETIIPKHPVVLGLCKQEDLEQMLGKYSK